MGYYFYFGDKCTKFQLNYQINKRKNSLVPFFFFIFAINMEQDKAITISLIIPVYNVSAYIERCLKSVIKQTYNHFECILVDDSSPDDSIAKCEQMIADYDGPIQFRIFHHEHNRGLSAARNTGTDAATGDYVLYIDSDDIISNDCVEKLMAPILKDDSIEMVLGENLRFSDEGLFNHQKYFLMHKEELTSNEAIRGYYFDINRRFPSVAWNKLISKKFINEHHIRFKEGQIWEDALWHFFMVKYLNHIFVIPDVTYFYYYRPDSISSYMHRKELRRHWCLVQVDISANLTLGDESREAAKHSIVFNDNYIYQPKTPEFRATAQRFSKALPFRKYPKEKMLLWAAMLLPHNHTGKEIFKWIQKQLFPYK